MAISQQPQYEPVDASPVKSFFVYMLTRDIELEEAILDLLDNCVDGILRNKRPVRGKKPYQGFKAEIEFKKDSFSITDNCGGINWDLHDYAFRMGRPRDCPAGAAGTVGTYGIGMKRAIFKMGEECLISTQNGNNGYEVEINPDWIKDEMNWKIPVKKSKRSMDEDGTSILIGNLYPGIAATFSENKKVFKAELIRMVATHYAFIIEKGFEVKINGDLVRPLPTQLIFQEIRSKDAPAIQPFIFKTKTEEGVEVFMAVGFTRPIPSQDEIADEQLEKQRYQSVQAGWTVLCNGRAVLYCDRSEMTGWGETGVPRYHTQFIAISGVVEFKSDDASKLPTTTTKRGIDSSSQLYLQIKNKMREGMRIFVNYTNKWKGQAEESKKHMEAGERLSFEEVKDRAKKLSFSATIRSVPKGEQYRPNLPMPEEPQKQRISFTKEKTDVQCVARYLFEKEDVTPSDVGKKCFDLIHKEARR